jgi:hypothetical protein
MNIAAAPKELQALVTSGKLPLNRARIAAALPDERLQVQLARKAAKGLTPKETAEAGKKLTGKRTAASTSGAIAGLRKAVSLVARARRVLVPEDAREAGKLVALIREHCSGIAGGILGE